MVSGPPAIGKTTVAKGIATEFNLTHLSGGDILKQQKGVYNQIQILSISLIVQLEELKLISLEWSFLFSYKLRNYIILCSTLWFIICIFIPLNETVVEKQTLLHNTI